MAVGISTHVSRRLSDLLRLLIVADIMPISMAVGMSERITEDLM